MNTQPITCYTILGIEEDASRADIDKAFRRLAREYHPDRRPGDAEAEAKYQDIRKAYEALSTPEKRRIYDENLNNTGTPLPETMFQESPDFGINYLTDAVKEGSITESSIAIDNHRSRSHSGRHVTVSLTIPKERSLPFPGGIQTLSNIINALNPRSRTVYTPENKRLSFQVNADTSSLLIKWADTHLNPTLERFVTDYPALGWREPVKKDKDFQQRRHEILPMNEYDMYISPQPAPFMLSKVCLAVGLREPLLTPNSAREVYMDTRKAYSEWPAVDPTFVTYLKSHLREDMAWKIKTVSATKDGEAPIKIPYINLRTLPMPDGVDQMSNILLKAYYNNAINLCLQLPPSTTALKNIELKTGHTTSKSTAIMAITDATIIQRLAEADIIPADIAQKANLGRAGRITKNSSREK